VTRARRWTSGGGTYGVHRPGSSFKPQNIATGRRSGEKREERRTGRRVVASIDDDDDATPSISMAMAMAAAWISKPYLNPPGDDRRV
jgi:hypothetical protein